MNPLDAPFVARDVWLSTEDGSTPPDQSAAHFVLRMFQDGPLAQRDEPRVRQPRMLTAWDVT